MTVPRTVGRTPIQRLRPALPILMLAVLGVADLADGGAAGDEHAAHLGRGHAQDGVVAFLAHELDAGAGGTGE